MTESYSVAQYVQDARAAIADIYGRGKLPIVAGGTGLYISSLVNGIEFTEMPRDEALSARLEMKAQQEGGEALLQELAAIDPETAARMHPNNLGRIVRALEVYYTTGITMTEQMRRSRLNAPNWKLGMLGITYADRGVLYDRINRRVTQMMDMGLEAETRRVLSQPGGKTALQAIGYKEVVAALEGRCTMDEARSEIKIATRRYAKRQRTWFRKDKRIVWIDANEPNFDEMGSEILCRKSKR
jgi:tRNA dimethylallyltransferase